MSVQADGNSWKGRAKHITSLLYSTKHVRSPDWPGNHRLYIADKKREMPRNKMTLLCHLLIIMFVFPASISVSLIWEFHWARPETPENP